MQRILFMEINWKLKSLALFLSFFGILTFINCSNLGELKTLSNNTETRNSSNSETNTSEISPRTDDKVASYKGITFHYNGILADEVLAKDLSAYIPKNPKFLPDTFEPRHITFQFNGTYAQYHAESSFQPEINIYSIDEYKKLAQQSGDYAVAVQEKFRSLETILSNKPSEIKGEYPFIPWIDATQAVHSHKSYIFFKNGNGIAYLTQFNNDIYLISNRKLVYVFQGITADNKYFISATFPVRTSFLPEDPNAYSYKGYTIPDEFYNRQQLERNKVEYQQYLLRVQAELDSTPDKDFEPSLSNFEKLLESLEIQSDIFSSK